MFGMGNINHFFNSLTDIGNQNIYKKANQQGERTTQAALGELTPEAINHLMSLFYTHFYSQFAPQMQGAQQGLAAAGARHGLTGTGAMQQLSAGIPGQFAGMAMNSALPAAMHTAGQRAEIQAGRPNIYGGQSGGSQVMDLIKAWLGSNGGSMGKMTGGSFI